VDSVCLFHPLPSNYISVYLPLDFKGRDSIPKSITLRGLLYMEIFLNMILRIYKHPFPGSSAIQYLFDKARNLEYNESSLLNLEAMILINSQVSIARVQYPSCN